MNTTEISGAIERIRQMESILDQATQKLDALEESIAALEAYQPEIQKLASYYTGGEWMKDFTLDETGKLPADLKRGVLSEDGIYNMLERNRELMEQIREVQEL